MRIEDDYLITDEGARAHQPGAPREIDEIEALMSEAAGALGAVTPAHDGRTLETERALFEIPDDVTYLNCASMSPQLRTVTAAGSRRCGARRRRGTLRASDWFVHAEPLRALFGRVIGADAESVALVPSVSYGLAVAAANVPVRAGQSILVIDREFPSGMYTWRELARRTGARVRHGRRASPARAGRTRSSRAARRHGRARGDAGVPLDRR